jgi:hypothetical protein
MRRQVRFLVPQRDTRKRNAIATAEMFLHNRICECGAWIQDHSREVLLEAGFLEMVVLSLRFPDAPSVSCRRFRPVRFKITRKSESEQ